MASVIKFGTSGWRGLIARDFTFANVRLAAQATADYLKSELLNARSEIFGRKPVVIIGYDSGAQQKQADDLVVVGFLRENRLGGGHGRIKQRGR